MVKASRSGSQKSGSRDTQAQEGAQAQSTGQPAGWFGHSVPQRASRLCVRHALGARAREVFFVPGNASVR